MIVRFFVLCKGKGVKKNAAEAAKWWRKAADQGHAQAQFELGCLYYVGEGVEQDGAEVLRTGSLRRFAFWHGVSDTVCQFGWARVSLIFHSR